MLMKKTGSAAPTFVSSADLCRRMAGELGNSPVTENTNKINGAMLMWGSILDRALYRVEWTE